MRKRWLVVSAVIIGIVVFFFLIRAVLLPLVVSFALAYLLDPIVDYISKRRIPRPVAALGLMALAACILIAIFVLLLPTIIQQVRIVIAEMPTYSASFMSFVKPSIARIDKVFPGGIDALMARGIEAAKANAPKLLSPLAAFLATTFSSVVNFILGLLNIILIPVMTYYFLSGMKKVKSTVNGLIPPRYRATVNEQMHEIDRVLSAFVRGQLTVCTILALLYGIGLSLLGVPMALFWALLGGYGNLIPYVGTLSSSCGAMLFTLLQYHDLRRTMLVGSVFILAHILEGSIISPRIVGESVGLNPVVIMAAVVVGGSLFGLIGMLLAVPTVAVAVVFIKSGHQWYLLSDYYQTDRKAE